MPQPRLLFDTHTGNVLEFDTELEWCQQQLDGKWHQYILILLKHTSDRCNKCYGRNYEGHLVTVDGERKGYQVCQRLRPQPFFSIQALKTRIEMLTEEQEETEQETETETPEPESVE